MTRFKENDIVYIIANRIYIREARVIRATASTRMYTLVFTDGPGSTRLRESRLFATREEAEKSVRKDKGSISN